jgi:transcription elongation factor Elf1
MKEKKMWEKIEDNCVRHLWQCPHCGKGAMVNPSDYEDIGTPMCADCDRDMEYLYTEIKKE